MFSYSNFNQNNKLAGYYEDLPTSYLTEPLSPDFEVKVNGVEVPVYACRISKHPFNRVFLGYQRPYEQTERASFLNLVSDEPLSLEIKAKKSFARALLKPYSRGVQVCVDGDTIRFTLEKNGHFVLALDDWHGCLHLFNSKPVPAPAKSEVTHYFGAGIHVVGKLVLKSGESVYVDKDALVYGHIFAKDAENIKVFGNGLLDDSMEERFPLEAWLTCYEEYTNGNIRLMNCKNVEVRGVMMRNSAVWCFGVFGCENVDVNDVKIFGQWRYNTDGIDLVNSQKVTIRNSFIHSFDDGIVLKGVVRFCAKDVKEITAENCVVWCDWGRALEIGIETVARRFSSVTFKDCDVIRGGAVALDIQNGNEAEIAQVRYENIRVELNNFDTPEVYQKTDETVYDKEGVLALPKLISVSNPMLKRFSKPLGYTPDESFGKNPASVHDVIYEGICVYVDEGIKENPVVEYKDEREQGKVYGISVGEIEFIRK
ncbi:MAG: hypothetical protein IJX81_02775 [Clostridia bacterium]|nr:hypothetical protein [Clostridia bacterium]